ncbi:hypothetical protein NC651_009399 [Populus alba x Populus x berolinensis]|nr:hypothetical protein NC651_009399 [Populus alba x Populus x berolinensis]
MPNGGYGKPSSGGSGAGPKIEEIEKITLVLYLISSFSRINLGSHSQMGSHS